MANPFGNMDPEDWPEGLSPEDQEQVFEIVQDVRYMTEHQDDGPLPGTS